MPSRRDVFINHNYYHIFNKTLDNRQIFQIVKISRLFLALAAYYRSAKADLRYSHFIKLTTELKRTKERVLKYQKYFKIDMLAYCLMPNHFHLLLKQNAEKGVIRFMSDVINALTRFYNNLNSRKGPLFIPQFKSRMIVSEEQLIHVTRYIHLNPYSSGITISFKELINYPYSSFSEYLEPNKAKIVNTQMILNIFNNNIENYKKFVLNNAKHQKTIEAVKYIETDRWL